MKDRGQFAQCQTKYAKGSRIEQNRIEWNEIACSKICQIGVELDEAEQRKLTL